MQATPGNSRRGHALSRTLGCSARDANSQAGGSLKKAESPNGSTDFMQVSDVSDCVVDGQQKRRHIKNISTSQDNWRCPEHRVYL